MDISQHLYTVEQANALLPEIETRLEALQAVVEGLRPSAPSPSDRGRWGWEGGTAVEPTYFAGLERIDAEQRWLQERGIILRDLERGLIDFPAMLEGRPVFLCWVRGEGSIGFFHEPDSGFAGRKPIPLAD